MPDALVDQLEAGIEALMSVADLEYSACDPEIRELLSVAGRLRALPDPEFQARLKADLMETAEQSAVGSGNRSIEVLTTGKHGETLSGVLSVPASMTQSGRTTNAEPDVPFDLLPLLFGAGQYPVQRSSFMASLVAHAAAIALIVTSGIWAAQGVHEKPLVHSVLVTDITYVLPAAADESHGGGGGGDHDILQASKGSPPRFAREQLAPPAIVVRNEQPKFPVEPTVVGPPNLSFPQTSRMGDPLSGILGPASNGTGSGGGIGSGNRGGVGPGNGPGVGPGWGGGIGDGPYRAGGGVTAPRAIYDPEPEYSEEARKAKYQGIAILQVVVDAEGRARDIRVARSAGMGLDEKATEAVRQWRFEPGTKDGRPVAVVVNVQVNFRLY
jgi:TonB family protein